MQPRHGRCRCRFSWPLRPRRSAPQRCACAPARSETRLGYGLRCFACLWGALRLLDGLRAYLWSWFEFCLISLHVILWKGSWVSKEPVGERFSLVYLRNPELMADSKRMRRRLAALFCQFPGLARTGAAIEQELGISAGYEARESYFWPKFLDRIDLRDVMDAITIRFSTINDYRDAPDAEKRAAFLKEVSRIFAEEDVRYRVDKAGGVHFSVDAEFERVRTSTIAALGPARYDGVRTLFDQAFGALDKSPPDGKAAIRSAFFATESLFRLIYPSAHQLSGSEVQKHLKPTLDVRFDGQKPAIYLAQKQLAAFIDWIDGAHFYRHEPGTEEPAQPPLELAIYTVSQAGAHLRWLAAFDR